MISVKKHLSNPGSYQFGQDLSVRNQRCRTNIKEGKNHDKQWQFQNEVANELGVPLKNGYNGDLTSKQNGSVGGEMVRQMIKRQEQEMAGK